MKKFLWSILFLLITSVYLSADLFPEKIPREEYSCEDILGTC